MPGCTVDRAGWAIDYGAPNGVTGGGFPMAGPGFRERIHVPARPKPRGEASPQPTAATVPLEDLELVERVRGGESAAYGDLVRKYQDRVFNACVRISGNVEDARDHTQEAFLRAFARLAEFKGLSSFYTWVFRIAVNLALTEKRTSARRQTVSLDADPSIQGTQAAELGRRLGERSTAASEGAVTEAEIHGHLLRALQALDAEFRAVIVLRDIEGLDYQQIGEILEVPAGTVKSRLHRGRMLLRQAILPLISDK